MNLYARFSEDERAIPPELVSFSFAVPDAVMEMEDGILVSLGSDWRFDCRWTRAGLLIEEIWIKRDSGRSFVFASFDLSEAATSKNICAAMRRYYQDNPRGRRSLRWYADAQEHDAALEGEE